MDTHSAKSCTRVFTPPPPVVRVEDPSRLEAPRSIPVPVQKATVNCYATLHAGKDTNSTTACAAWMASGPKTANTTTAASPRTNAFVV